MEAIKPRGYQMYILGKILKAKVEKYNVIVELDAGMGKRVISYLMANYLEPGERLLFITPSRASLRDTYMFFEENIKESSLKVGYLGSNMPKFMRKRVVLENDIVISTPISLYNVAKEVGILDFNYIFINEVDKTVRRVVNIPIYDNLEEYLSMFTLIYPWMHLRKLLNKDACWVGLSGTLRDHHTIRTKDTIFLKRELETIGELLFPKEKKVEIITMEEIIKKTDAYQYIVENITMVKRIPISDTLIKRILDPITEEIYSTAKKLISKYSKEDGEKIDPSAYDKIERAISKLPDIDPLKQKFLRLALIRRFILASTPNHYKRYLRRPSITKLIKKEIEDFNLDMLPTQSKKIERIVEITKKWVQNRKKVAIMCSFIRTAVAIKQELEKEGMEPLILTGKTPNKAKVIEEYKKKDKPILILTPVGERDLDLTHTDLLIIHDIISTVKSMYQRIKRGRRSFVAITYYKDTHEEAKLNTLLQRIKKRYPWSTVIE